MSELVSTLIEAVAELRANDRSFRRFGAAVHRYELQPALGPEAIAAIEQSIGPLPDEYRDFIGEVSAGGAGPAYGLFAAERAAKHVFRDGGTTWLPLGHFGCGYAVALALDGKSRGEVWLHAKAIGVVAAIRPSFSTYYIDWIDRLARNTLPDTFVPAAACALPAALTGYLGVWERRLGVAAGALEGEPLREALGNLGEGAIELASEASTLFLAGERVDPCLSCARLVENLGKDGLTPSVIAAGVPPLPVR